MGWRGRVGRLSGHHTFTLRENILKGPPATFSRGLPLPQETAHTRIPRRSFRVGGGAVAAGEGRGEERPGLQSES